MLSIILNCYTRNESFSKCRKTLKSCIDLLQLLGNKGELIIYDDSGAAFTNDEYLMEKFDLSESDIIKYNIILAYGKENYGLFKARSEALVYANHKYIRFVDNGDKLINNDYFCKEFIKLVDINYDLILLRQDNGYYSTYGSTSNLDKIRLSGLSSLMCCSMWSKVFKKDKLIQSYNKVFRYLGNYIRIFHLEDYLASNIYLIDCKNLISIIDLPTIHYDYVSGESNNINIDKVKYSEIKSELNDVRDCIYDHYMSIMDNKVLKYLLDLRVNLYMSRFKVSDV